jgi:hypothetical protein
MVFCDALIVILFRVATVILLFFMEIRNFLALRSQRHPKECNPVIMNELSRVTMDSAHEIKETPFVRLRLFSK